MTSAVRTYLRYAISIILMVVFLYLTFRGTDLKTLFASMLEANYWWIFLMFLFLLASHFVRAWRWRYLLEPMKPDIGMRNLFSGVMVGYMGNNVLPRAGELMRPYTIGKLEGIPKSAAFGTIVVERIMDTVSFLIIIALIPLVYNGPLRETFPWLNNALMIVSLVTFLFMATIIVFVIRRDWTDKMIKLVGKILPRRLAELVERLTHNFLDGFLFVKRPHNLILILIQSIVVWFFYICMMYVAFFAFDMNLDFKAAIVIQGISSIGMALPTPGGTGSYHMFTSQPLSKLFGVSDPIALSYATVTHGFIFLGTTVIGLYYFFKDHIKVSEAVSKREE